MTASARPIVVLVFCISVVSTPLAAQPCGTVIPGPAQGLGPRLTADGSLRAAMRAEDRTAIERTLTVVDQLVRKTVYGTPRGYYAFTRFIYDPPGSRTHLSAYGFGHVMFCPTVAAVGGDGTAGIEVTFNPDPQLWSESDRPMPDERGDRIYTERIRKPPQLGATLTFGDFDDVQDVGLRLLFTAGGESPTLPVTREEYLRALIVAVEGTPTKKSAYREWMEQAPARRRSLEETVTLVAASDPAKAAQLRRDLEKSERDLTEQFKAAEGQTSTLADPFRARIAAMSTAERAMPAFVSGYDFVPESSPNAHAIVRENPAFYRARRSPVEPRAVLVRIPQRTYRELEAERRQMFREFDWAALRNLVAPQP